MWALVSSARVWFGKVIVNPLHSETEILGSYLSSETSRVNFAVSSRTSVRLHVGCDHFSAGSTVTPVLKRIWLPHGQGQDAGCGFI